MPSRDEEAPSAAELTLTINGEAKKVTGILSKQWQHFAFNGIADD